MPFRTDLFYPLVFSNQSYWIRRAAVEDLKIDRITQRQSRYVTDHVLRFHGEPANNERIIVDIVKRTLVAQWT